MIEAETARIRKSALKAVNDALTAHTWEDDSLPVFSIGSENISGDGVVKWCSVEGTLKAAAGAKVLHCSVGKDASLTVDEGATAICVDVQEKVHLHIGADSVLIGVAASAETRWRENAGDAFISLGKGARITNVTLTSVSRRISVGACAVLHKSAVYASADVKVGDRFVLCNGKLQITGFGRAVCIGADATINLNNGSDSRYGTPDIHITGSARSGIRVGDSFTLVTDGFSTNVVTDTIQAGNNVCVSFAEDNYRNTSRLKELILEDAAKLYIGTKNTYRSLKLPKLVVHEGAVVNVDRRSGVLVYNTDTVHVPKYGFAALDPTEKSR